MNIIFKTYKENVGIFFIILAINLIQTAKIFGRISNWFGILNLRQFCLIELLLLLWWASDQLLINVDKVRDIVSLIIYIAISHRLMFQIRPREEFRSRGIKDWLNPILENAFGSNDRVLVHLLDHVKLVFDKLFFLFLIVVYIQVRHFEGILYRISSNLFFGRITILVL